MAIAAMPTSSDPVSIRERPEGSSVDRSRSPRRASAADHVEEDRRVEIEPEAASVAAATAMEPETEAWERTIARAEEERRVEIEVEAAIGAAPTAMEPETEARELAIASDEKIASAEEQMRAGDGSRRCASSGRFCKGGANTNDATDG